MRTIIFLEANRAGISRVALGAADRLGYHTVLFTGKESYWRERTNFPEIHEIFALDPKDIKKVRENINALLGKGRKIEAITSFLAPHVATAAALSGEFCRFKPSTGAVNIMADKIKTRMALKETPYNAGFWVYEGLEPASSFVTKQKWGFPLVLKPPHTLGSKDVYKAEDESQLLTYLEGLKCKYQNKPIILEEYLDGPQYLVEVLVRKGKVFPVAIIEQEITSEPGFVVTGYCVLANPPRAWRAGLVKAVSAIVNAIGLENGNCHLEMRLVDGAWKLLEANGRMAAGAVYRLIRAASGLNLVEETVKLMAGQKPRVRWEKRKYAFAQHITAPQEGLLLSVRGEDKARSCPGVEEVYVKVRPGRYLCPPYDMTLRYAYVIATGDTLEEARARAKAAAGKIRFELGPGPQKKEITS